MFFQCLGILLLFLTQPWIALIKEFLTPKVCACMVVTEQEGAHIFVNGKDTGKITPSLVSIPQGKEVQVQLKKEGYLDHSAWVRSKHELTFYHCQLQKFKLKLAVSNEDSMGL